MKNIKFSRLFAAVAFVAILALAGCKQDTVAAPDGIIGTWVSSYGEKFVITEDTVAETAFGMYEMEIEEIDEVDETSGVLYGILTKGSEYTPKDTYYAFAYKELTATTVKVAAAATSFQTLDEVKEACTIENMFAFASECTREE